MSYYTSYVILSKNDEQAVKIANHLNSLLESEVLLSRGGAFEALKEPQIRPMGEWRVESGVVLGAIKNGVEEDIKNAIKDFIIKDDGVNYQILVKGEHDDSWDFLFN